MIPQRGLADTLTAVAYSPAAKALRRCQGTSKNGEPCRAWALWGDAGQRCVWHSGQRSAPARRTGNRARVVPCTCPAYSWGHRPGGGLCRWPEPPTHRSTTPTGTHQWPSRLREMLRAFRGTPLGGPAYLGDPRRDRALVNPMLACHRRDDEPRTASTHTVAAPDQRERWPALPSRRFDLNGEGYRPGMESTCPASEGPTTNAETIEADLHCALDADATAEELRQALDPEAADAELRRLLDPEADAELRRLLDPEATDAELRHLLDPEAADAELRRLLDPEAADAELRRLLDPEARAPRTRRAIPSP